MRGDVAGGRILHGQRQGRRRAVHPCIDRQFDRRGKGMAAQQGEIAVQFQRLAVARQTQHATVNDPGPARLAVLVLHDQVRSLDPTQLGKGRTVQQRADRAHGLRRVQPPGQGGRRVLIGPEGHTDAAIGVAADVDARPGDGNHARTDLPFEQRGLVEPPGHVRQHDLVAARGGADAHVGQMQAGLVAVADA